MAADGREERDASLFSLRSGPSTFFSSRAAALELDTTHLGLRDCFISQTKHIELHFCSVIFVIYWDLLYFFGPLVYNDQ